MSSSSLDTNADERIPVTESMTNINTEISSVTTNKIVLITAAVLSAVVAAVIIGILLFNHKKVVAWCKSYTSRRTSTNKAKERENVTSIFYSGQDQGNTEERNSGEEIMSAEEQPTGQDEVNTEERSSDEKSRPTEEQPLIAVVP